MTTLALTYREPSSRSSGYDLRVDQLVRQTAGEVHLAVVPVTEDGLRTVGSGPLPPYRTVHRLTGLAEGPQSFRRHLRTSDSWYLRRSRPRAFAEVRDRLSELIAELDVDWVVVFGQDLTELVVSTGHPRAVLDVCDSFVLTRRRQLEVLPPASALGRAKARIDLARARSHEARLPRQFHRVTTISEQDSDEIRGLSGTTSGVVTIPNGVDEQFLGEMPPPGRRRGVAFWGNLDFGPNVEALRYFLHEVYQPHLEAQGVHVRIVGANAPTWLVELAQADTQVELTGFVDDLREAVADLPVVVNAMRTGSGMKNKVLEAFGIGLAVVTTTRGIEALASARAGTHVAVADDAPEFARAVLRLLDDEEERGRMRSAAHELLLAEYQWSVIGEAWRRLFDLGPAPTGPGGSGRQVEP